MSSRYVHVPRFVKYGIRKAGGSCPKKFRLFGGDTETQDGSVRMLQVCDGVKVDCLRTNPAKALRDFLRHMQPLCRPGYYNLIGFHNLTFDAEVMLLPWKDRYMETKSFELNLGFCSISVCSGKIFFMDVDYGGGRTLHVRDTAKYVKGSLEKAAKKAKLPHQKSPKPAGLGEKDPFHPDVRPYAENDGWVTYDLTCWIWRELFQKYDVKPSVSFSQFSQRVYQKHFIDDGTSIPYPPDACSMMAERSYHGGKNGLYCKAPVIVEDCYDLDIVSAYAYSLWRAPQLIDAKYVSVNRYVPGAHGVYTISGRIKPLKHPILFKEGSMMPLFGEFKNLPVTSYELDLALNEGALDLDGCYGWVLKESGYERHAFKEFVEFWWNKKKEAEEESLEYATSKLGPNAIYGKMISKIEVDDVDEIEVRPGVIKPTDKVYKACTLYNPFGATLCTALTRVQLYGLEKRYDALHSATDAVKTLAKPEEKPGVLGGTEIELFGRCIILRNKLYMHFNVKGELEKFALHGFWGKPSQLLEMIERGVSEYKCDHMGKLRESMRSPKIKAHVMVRDIERKISVNLKEMYTLKADRTSPAEDLDPEADAIPA